MQLFHSINTMDWFRVFWVISAISAGWLVLAEIVPEKYHHVGTVILQAISTAVTLMMRSGKSLIEKAEDNVETAKGQVVEHIIEEATKKP
jgi:hypothetical protein